MNIFKPLHRVLSEKEMELVSRGVSENPTIAGGCEYYTHETKKLDKDVGGTWKWKG